MVFYVHDNEGGANVTAIPVAGIPGTKWSVIKFGTLFVFDNLVTEEYDQNSTQVGRVQGIYVNSALDGSSLHMLLSIVFTNKGWNGSTLEIQGANRFLQKYREFSIVSGTGKFRLAKGYVIGETVFSDLDTFNAILRWNLTIYHY